MNKPVPSPRIPVTAPREPATVRHDAAPAKSATFQLNVRFYRVMKPQRVYPLVVELPRASAKPVAGQAPLIVKPVIAGAVVAPAEQALDLNPAGSSMTFQVTPLVRGRMHGAHIEVCQQGRPVESMPLKMKAKTQRLTWLLLLATFVVPGVLLYYTSIAPLTGDVPQPSVRKQIARQNPGGAPLPAGAPAPGPDQGAQPTTTQIAEPRPGMPGEVLQYKISHLIHKNCPKPGYQYVDWLIKDQENYVVKEQPVNPLADETSDFVEWGAYWLGYAYQYLCTTATDLYPSFFCAMALGALSLLSLLSHRTLRGRARKSGIRISESAASTHARSATAREEPPTVVEAAD
jgi:hypothetical protein